MGEPAGCIAGGDRVRRGHRRQAGLYRLPAYYPPLNPDEWVWKNVKQDGVAPAASHGPEQMKSVVTARLRRLQRLPQFVRGFFGDPELAYITAVA